MVALAELFRAPSRRTVMQVGMLAGLGPLLPACSEVEAKPRVIKWGRDTCEFCHMVFADRRFAAEVWDGDTNRARLYDDFGCAVLAAAEMEVLEREAVRFWVSDETQPDTWLDARRARFRDNVVTPMGYGHSAGSGSGYRLDFAAASQAIRDKAACEHKP